MKNSIANPVNKYLSISNYNDVDGKTFELQLITHPDYPSFKSISDTLDYFGIENIVAQVPKDTLSKLPLTFLTTLITETGLKVCLVNRKSKHIIITNDKLETKRVSNEEFNKYWQGTIIVIEQSTKRKDKIGKVQLIGIVIFLILGSIILVENSSSFIYNFTAMLGLGLSYFIIKEDLGIYNPTINKACETISKVDGCKSVINDNGAKLFKYFSLSDLTLVYFSTQVLFLMFVGFDNFILFFIASLSIPVVSFSLFFQAIKIKKWCVLCICVSIILITQFIITYVNITSFRINFLHVFQILFLASFIFILLSIFKKLFQETIKLQSVEIAFLKFKRDSSLFNLLYKREKIKEKSSSLGTNRISFGSKNPKLIIDAITNPLCGFCSPTFLNYYSILKKNKDIQLNIIFSSFSSNFDNDGVKVSLSVLKIYFEKNEEVALKALKEWYENRDSEKWLKKYGVESVEPDYIGVLNNHQSWISANEIYHTPTTLINNYYYPKNYNIEDLVFFIDDIIKERNGL